MDTSEALTDLLLPPKPSDDPEVLSRYEALLARLEGRSVRVERFPTSNQTEKPSDVHRLFSVRAQYNRLEGIETFLSILASLPDDGEYSALVGRSDDLLVWVFADAKRRYLTHFVKPHHRRKERPDAIFPLTHAGWIFAASALAENPTEPVQCPECRAALLRVSDLYKPGSRTYERHITCPNCNAQNFLRKTYPAA